MFMILKKNEKWKKMIFEKKWGVIFFLILNEKKRFLKKNIFFQTSLLIPSLLWNQKVGRFGLSKWRSLRRLLSDVRKKIFFFKNHFFSFKMRKKMTPHFFQKSFFSLFIFFSNNTSFYDIIIIINMLGTRFNL